MLTDAKTVGMCVSRPLPYSSKDVMADVAFDLERAGRITTSSRRLFPNDLPNSFVILVTVKAEGNSSGDLFTMYDKDQHQLSFRLNPIELEFREGKNVSKVGYPISIADGKWHRIAFAVSADSIQVILDCDQPFDVLPRPKTFQPRLHSEGKIALGGRTGTFKVRNRQLPLKKLRSCRRVEHVEKPRCFHGYS